MVAKAFLSYKLPSLNSANAVHSLDSKPPESSMPFGTYSLYIIFAGQISIRCVMEAVFMLSVGGFPSHVVSLYTNLCA